MIRKTINLFYLLLIFTCCKAFALITQSINFTSFINYNKSGFIDKRDYESDLNMPSNKITVYNYFDKKVFPASLKNINATNYDGLESTLFFLSATKHTFVLIPRNLNFNINNYDLNNKLDKMESLIVRHSESFDHENSKIFTEFVNLANNFNCNQEFIPTVKNVLNGTHGLFSPEKSDKINEFDGFDRVLSLAITPIDSLFINSNFFENINATTKNYDLKRLQFLLLKTAQEAKTVLFVPECASHTKCNTTSLQPFLLPVAIIKEVYLAPDNNICLRLEFLKESRSVYYSIRRFNAVKNKLNQAEIQTELKHIDYKIKLTTVECNQNTENQQDTLASFNFKFSFLEAVIPHMENANNNTRMWPCEHYDRRCSVKFECCDKFWSCHRCHNASSTCSNTKLMALDAMQQKCLVCNYVQDIEDQDGQYCKRCKLKFADYFCSICKHITGTENNPGHCEKCGICRENKDKNYHCDVCGICLNSSLKNKHKCRKDATHEECPICLEDMFYGGVQMLPCSHRIHKNCFDKIPKKNVNKCPVCRKAYRTLNKP